MTPDREREIERICQAALERRSRGSATIFGPQRELYVTTVLEGSVRRAGDRVRISV